MKKSLALIGAFLIVTSSLANTSSVGFSKNSPQLRALTSVWKNHPTTISLKQDQNITIVYGGEDVSRHPMLS